MLSLLIILGHGGKARTISGTLVARRAFACLASAQRILVAVDFVCLVWQLSAHCHVVTFGW